MSIESGKTARGKSPTLWERVGLGRPELRAWAMYDWANSAFLTIVVTAVYPLFFMDFASAGEPAAAATARHGYATFIALAIVAVLSPFLGALADFAPLKKKFLGIALTIGAIATACLAWVPEGGWMWAAGAFIVANIGVTASIVFYDSLLPHIASNEEMDRVSTAGYAMGYLGGGLLLLVSMVAIARPDLMGLKDTLTATRLSFVAVAVWWVLFSIPLFRKVPEPPIRLESDESLQDSPLVAAWVRLGETFREIKGYKQAFILLLAVMVYNDGVGTIFRMATSFGREIGLPTNHLIAAILVVQFVGIPAAFAFGAIAGRIGTKRAIYIGLFVYTGISIGGYFVKTSAHFFILAFMVALVQGGTQALSRSLFATMIPRHKSSEFFGFFAIFEKFAGTLGPLVFASVTAATGSSRNSIVAVVIFFVVGALILSRVDVKEGQRVARLSDEDCHD